MGIISYDGHPTWKLSLFQSLISNNQKISFDDLNHFPGGEFSFRVGITSPIDLEHSCTKSGSTIAASSGLTHASQSLSFRAGVSPILRGNFSVRSFLVMLLTGLLLACPLLCGADEIGHSTQHEISSDDTGRGHSSDHCPEGSDNCVCRGAVQADDVRAELPVAMAIGLLFLPIERPCLSLPAHHLTSDGSPTGLAAWGDALTVRAYLQNFRF